MIKLNNKRNIKSICMWSNVTLIIMFAVLFITFNIFKNTEKFSDFVKITAVFTLLTFVLILVLNFVVYIFEIKKKNKVSKTISKYLLKGESQYALNYIIKTNEKENFNSVNQVLLYYLGYIHLLNNEVEKGVAYLKKFDLDNQKIINSEYYLLVIFLLHTVLYIIEDPDYNYVFKKYDVRKKQLARYFDRTKFKDKANILNNAIIYLNNDSVDLARDLINQTNFCKIPIIDSYINNKNQI